jgi:N-acylneuraminate cytidylyltransferase
VVRRAGAVAFVPARSGSDSVPRKNVRPLCGIPLLAYSIEAGLKARHVEQVIVLTDDEEIAGIARNWGAEVPFLIPARSAGDTTFEAAAEQALEWLRASENHRPDIVVRLPTTSPLRPPDCVDIAIELLRREASVDAVQAVVPVSQDPHEMWRLRVDGTMKPLLAENAQRGDGPSHELPPTYWQTGHLNAVRTDVIRAGAAMVGNRIRALVIDGAYSCDLETEADWQRAEWTLEHLDRPVVRPVRGQFPRQIRLVVFDFDGVMTDNRVWVGAQGDEWVACNRGDGLGLEQLRRLGLDLLVLSTEPNPVVASRCRKLGLPFEQGVADKAVRLGSLLRDRGIAPSDVIYVGNDLNDAGCMRLVGCGVAVADAHPDVSRAADVRLTRRGGHGAVRELCDRVVAHMCGGDDRT